MPPLAWGDYEKEGGRKRLHNQSQFSAWSNLENPEPRILPFIAHFLKWKTIPTKAVSKWVKSCYEMVEAKHTYDEAENPLVPPPWYGRYRIHCELWWKVGLPRVGLRHCARDLKPGPSSSENRLQREVAQITKQQTDVDYVPKCTCK